MDSWSEAMMSSLINLSPRQFSDLTHILAAESHYKLLRLSSLLRSPRRFSQLFRQLQTLPLHQKYMLISRMLLRSLARITQILEIDNVKSSSEAIGGGRDGFRDFDAGLLLILLSEVHGGDRKPTSPAEWQAEAVEYFISKVLSLSELRVPKVVILGSHIEELSRFRRLLEAVSEETGGKTAVAAASAATVVSLPRVACRGGKKECVICREELEEGSEGCLLPCSHVFHCHCILRWLRSRNTCPSCRFELPTDDVVCEIERLCRVVTQMGKKGCQAMNEGMP